MDEEGEGDATEHKSLAHKSNKHHKKSESTPKMMHLSPKQAAKEALHAQKLMEAQFEMNYFSKSLDVEDYKMAV